MKSAAKANFQRNYWLSVLVGLLMLLAIGGSSGGVGRDSGDVHQRLRDILSGQTPLFYGILTGLLVAATLVGLAIHFLLGNPFSVGADRFFMENRNGAAPLSAVGAGFTAGYGNVVLTLLLRDLYIFLWSLLLVIPGIVRAYGYFAVPFLLAENPSMPRDRALTLSRQMTRGWKTDIFVTHLSFLLWFLLASITAGIAGVFYVNPYVYSTEAEMYVFLRAQALQNGLASPEELPGFGEAEAAD